MSNQPTIIKKAAVAIIQDRKVLMGRNSDVTDVYYFIGGSIEEGETPADCVIREVQEELNAELDASSVSFLETFEDWAHGKSNTRLHMHVFTGSLVGEPQPTSEISDIAYFNSQDSPENLSAIAINHILPYLKTNGYID